jgi:SM-20-related protein
MNPSRIDPAACAAHGTQEPACMQIAAALGTQGWCVTPDFLPPAQVGAMRETLQALWQRGEFRPAGVGRGGSLRRRPEVRTDWVHWIDPRRCAADVRRCLDSFEMLRLAVNRTLFLGLFEFEAHLAVYPPGTCYRKHLDQFRDIGNRCVSCVLYLNEAWRPTDGGQLRIYTDPHDEHACMEIQPLGGQLVTFLSARYLHEVLPANRERMSITGWFSTRH